MRYFHKLASGLDVRVLVHSIARQPELWNVNRLRTTYPGTPHTEVSDIWLRFQDSAQVEEPQAGEVTVERGRMFLDEHESINYPAFACLPAARQIIWDLMRLVEGERLGRVLITRLAPGCKIAPHADGGAHAAYYDRYHVALVVLPGVVFRAGNEQVLMTTGDVWWFDNSQEHEVINNSADDRLTMIVDIRTGHRK